MCYINVTFSVLTGILVRKCKQAVAERLGKFIKPFALIFVIFLLSFGLYCNRYIYSQIKTSLYVLLPALLQPYLGFAISFLIAKYIARQPKHRCITIAIETGVQNVTIPMVLLQQSFPQPYGDLAAVMPVTTAHFTPLPMFFSFLGLLIYRNICLKYCLKKENEEDPESDESEKKVTGSGQEMMTRGTPDYSGVVKEASETDNFINGLSGNDIGKRVLQLDKESVI